MNIIDEPVKFKSSNFVFLGEIYHYDFVAATVIGATTAAAVATAVSVNVCVLPEVARKFN